MGGEGEEEFKSLQEKLKITFDKAIMQITM